MHILVAVFSAASSAVYSQDETDAFRLIGNTTAGTARSLGMGGAFCAVGADFSSAWLNPAGLGLFRKSELEFTGQLRLTSNSTSYLDKTQSAGKSNLSISNIGYVYYSKVREGGLLGNPNSRPQGEGQFKESGFKSWTFSLGYNQADNYNRNTKVVAFNELNSIAEYFAAGAQGIPATTLAEEYSFSSLAFNTGLIDTAGSDYQYVPSVRGNVQQEIDILETGRKTEWSVGFGGNVSDLFYFGATVGIQDVKYEYDLDYKEQDSEYLYNGWGNDSIPFSNLDFQNYFRTRGSGMNARAGIIVRPSDFLRIGFSVTSPTWLNLKDLYYTSLSLQVDNNSNVYEDKLTEGFYEYNLFSPYKLTVGGVFLYKKMGFVSADFEYTDYSTAAFKSNYIESSPYYYSFQDENAAMARLFDFAYNYRLGAEYRLGVFRFRGGYSAFGSVLKKENLFYPNFLTGKVAKLTGGRKIMSLGFGLKLENFYLDLAIQREHSEDRQLFYLVPDLDEYSPEMIRKLNSIKTLLTTGFTF